jgi:uncharacterized membrane protein YfcA
MDWNVLDFTCLVGLGSLAAGFLGALTGLGGGVVIVPLLALVFGVELHYAMGASLISVIATSSGAASTYVREGYSNFRIGMLLEIATNPNAIAIVFGIALMLSAYLSMRMRKPSELDGTADPLATRLRLDGSFPTSDGERHYHVHRVPLGFGLMFGAGTLSGLLGIGSGAFKVLAMDQAMRIPFKVSTTTSNFMIGVTAAASAGIYLNRGYIDPGLVMPVVLGVLAGSMAGAKVLLHANTRVLRIVFAGVIVIVGLQMIYKGMTGNL